jgi:hypothetical protein
MVLGHKNMKKNSADLHRVFISFQPNFWVTGQLAFEYGKEFPLKLVQFFLIPSL